MNSHYRILGLSTGASKAEIKRAYRKLALKYHPDHNTDPGAKERFLAVTEAYNYLMDPPSRPFQSSTKKTGRSADEERIKRARAKAKAAARQRYAAFKKQQEAEQSRAYSQALSIFMAIVLLLGAFYFGWKYIVQWQVNSDPAQTICTVVNHDVRNIVVSYHVDGTRYVKKYACMRSKLWLVTPNGMPVVNGAEFTIRYKKNNPKWAILLDEDFTPKTLDLYIEAVRFEVAKNMQVDADDARVECLSLLTFEAFGIDGLANLFFWQESPLENFSHNSSTYESMAESAEFQRIKKDCLNAQNRFPDDVDEP